MTDDTFENDTPAPGHEVSAAQAGAAEAAEAPEAVEGAETTTEPTEGATEATEEAQEVRPREVIKGIHPELLCEDPECGPEFTELQFFSPEESVKQKGKIMLFCARSGKKYFAPAPELQAWIAENKIVKTGRGRKDG